MIDENKLKEQLFALVEQIGDERLHIDAVVHLIDDAPAVDAVPVRHGRWERGLDKDDDWISACSVCGEVALYDKADDAYLHTLFCPWCGARMDGKGNGNETD